MKLPNFENWSNGELSKSTKIWLSKSNVFTFWDLPITPILQNSMITFDYSWFLAKNLSNFVSLPWKLYNRYCHSEYPPEGKLVNPASLQWDGIMYEIVMLYTDLLRFLRNIYIVWAKDCNLCIAEKAHILEADTKTSLNNRSEMLTMCRHKAKFLLKNVK